MSGQVVENQVDIEIGGDVAVDRDCGHRGSDRPVNDSVLGAGLRGGAVTFRDYNVTETSRKLDI